MIARISGNGPDLALLHGWGIGSYAWEAVLEPLAAQCRVHVIDLPGYGGTPAVQQAPAGFSATAQALIDALPCGTTLCGWSMGAQLALQAAHIAPQHFAGLVLLGATPRFMRGDGWLAAQPREVLENFNSAVQQDASGTLQRFIALLNQGDAQARTIGRKLLAGLRNNPLADTTTLLTGLAWLRDTDLRALVPEIALPTLLIHGENDPLMPLAAAQWLADKLPDARLECLAGTAHAPFLADTARFAEWVGAFCMASP